MECTCRAPASTLSSGNKGNQKRWKRVGAPPRPRTSLSQAGGTHAKITFEGPTLGIAFCPNGTPGMLQPGGEAEEKGLQYSDKVIRVGDDWCDGEDEIKAAVARHPERPLTLTVSRKKPAPPSSTFVNAHLLKKLSAKLRNIHREMTPPIIACSFVQVGIVAAGYWVVGATGVRAGRSRALRCTPKLQRDYGYESRKPLGPPRRSPVF